MNSSGPPVRSRRKVQWELLKGKDLERPGATLINLILATATNRKIGMTSIGKEAIGVGPSYFYELRMGIKPISKLGDEHIEHAASFLGMPKAAVLVAADRLRTEDFRSPPNSFQKFVVPALRQIHLDSEFGHFVPACVLEEEAAVQRCLVLLYEKATKLTLMPRDILLGPLSSPRGSKVSRLVPKRSNRSLEWEPLSGEDLSRTGATLIHLILSAAMDRRIGMKEVVSGVLDISSSYFHALRRGKRPMAQLSERCIERAAGFLGISKVAAFVAAGWLKLRDFYGDPAIFDKYLPQAIRNIQLDPDVGKYMPPNITKVDRGIQGVLVLLYEKSTGMTLIPGKVPPETIAERHDSLASIKRDVTT